MRLCCSTYVNMKMVTNCVSDSSEENCSDRPYNVVQCVNYAVHDRFQKFKQKNELHLNQRRLGYNRIRPTHVGLHT